MRQSPDEPQRGTPEVHRTPCHKDLCASQVLLELQFLWLSRLWIGNSEWWKMWGFIHYEKNNSHGSVAWVAFKLEPGSELCKQLMLIMGTTKTEVEHAWTLDHLNLDLNPNFVIWAHLLNTEKDSELRISTSQRTKAKEEIMRKRDCEISLLLFYFIIQHFKLRKQWSSILAPLSWTGMLLAPFSQGKSYGSIMVSVINHNFCGIIWIGWWDNEIEYLNLFHHHFLSPCPAIIKKDMFYSQTVSSFIVMSTKKCKYVSILYRGQSKWQAICGKVSYQS